MSRTVNPQSEVNNDTYTKVFDEKVLQELQAIKNLLQNINSQLELHTGITLDAGE